MRTVPRVKSRFCVSLVGGSMLALALAGCDGAPPLQADLPSRPSDPTPLGPGCDAQPDPHCNNEINRVVIQMLRGSNLAIADENKTDLCNRMALDLIGRMPTADEATFCATATADQMADRFMGMPEYIRQQNRSFTDHFYDLDEQWYLYIAEIDDMTTALFRGQMRYDDFMTRFIVHPGFYARYQGDDWASNVVRFALDRPARADEVASMRPLQQVWQDRYFCDGIVWFNGLQDNNFIQTGADLSCGRTEWALNYCHCRDDHGNSTCQTNTFGALVDFGADGCADPAHADDNSSNLLRGSFAAAGRVAICPSGPSLPECADRQMNDMGPATQLSRLGQIDGGQQDRLYSLGRALAARPDFWEAAVDRELRRFLNWWQNGLRRPDFDIPDVRSVLATELRRTGSLREIQRTIVTSLLFTQPSELAPGVMPPADPTMAPPLWSMGPTRVLTGERWLDSAINVTFGLPLGNCDYRYVASTQGWSHIVDRRLVTTLPVAQNLGPLTAEYATDYRPWSQALGGCSAAVARPTTSTLAIASAQNYIAQKLCVFGFAVVPPGFNSADLSPANLATGIQYIYRRALRRDPTADELSTAQTEVGQCLAEGPNGCPDAETTVRWMCERILDSAEFAIY